MSSPADFYNSLPPVSKAFGSICFAATVGYHLGIINPHVIALDYGLVFSKFQIWRLLTNFFFLGPFSMQFGMRILMIARYGVQLEKGPFDRRTADFLWMMLIAAFSTLALALGIPVLRFYFMGNTLVFMLLYIWSREFVSSRVSIMGLFQLQGFYLPWMMLGLNAMFGAPFLPDLLGVVIGHAYYFITVMHPRNGGRILLRTPLWVHRLTDRWEAAQVYQNPSAAVPPRGTFTGRSYRLNN